MHDGVIAYVCLYADGYAGCDETRGGGVVRGGEGLYVGGTEKEKGCGEKEKKGYKRD